MIKKVLLQNFKNYENQEIEFPSSGFILIAGPNGSGKSGIGEAIGFNLGLEGLMSFLRQSGRKITDLIKYEAEESMITLTLDNSKKYDYLPFQTNSNFVEIVRKIRKDGTSSIKAIGFATVLTTLQDIHRTANFNSTNPFIFIPQGKLSDLIPLDIDRKSDIKYLEEFEKITGLTELKTKMSESNEKLQESLSILNSFTTEKYQPTLKYLTEMEKIFEMYIDFECKKLELLASQLIYHLIQKYQVEQEYNQILEQLTTLKITHQETLTELKEIEQKQRDFKSNKQELLQIIKEKNQISIGLLEKKKSIELELNNAQKTQLGENIKLKNFELRKKELAEKIKGLKDQLEILSKESTEDEKTKELITQLNLLENEQIVLKQKKEEKLNELLGNYFENLKKINKSIIKEQDFYEQMQFLRENIKKVEKEITDKNSRFYPEIKKILDFIKAKNLKILGPAGNYIEVLNSKAWEAIEIALGYNFLHSFITFEENDQRELDKYILKNKISNINCYWFPPQIKLPKIRDNSIENDEVLGRVIDLIRITEAPINLILNEYNGKDWIVCKDDETANDIAKNHRITAISIRGLIKKPTRYGSGVNSSYREAFKRILSLGSRKSDLELYQKEYNELIALNKKFDSDKKGTSEFYNSEIKALSDKIEDLKQSLKNQSTAYVEIQIRLDENQKILEHLQSEIETSQNILKEASILSEEIISEKLAVDTEINQIAPEIAKIDSELREYDDQLNKFQQKLDELNEKLAHININDLENKVENLKLNLNQFNTIIEELLTKAEDLLKEVKESFQKASPVELRILRPKEELLMNILNLKTNEEIKNWKLLDVHDDIIKLETILSATKVSFEIVEKYTSAKKEFDALDEQKKHLEITIQIREAEYKKNFEDWYNQIKELLEKLKTKFKEYIESIGGNGYIKISNLENPIMARMDLFATFKENTPPRSISSHTHSGGEKTMIIMAFILALQSIKPQPFYILDEPDAHLDPENRDKLFTMIKEASKETQYIVISPQENREKNLIPDAVYYLFNSEGKTVIKKLN